MGRGLRAVLGTDVPGNAPLMSVGLDSIASVEFAQAVSEEVWAGFSAIMLFDHPTLDSIAGHLMMELEVETSATEQNARTVEADTEAAVSLPEDSAGGCREVSASTTTMRFQLAGSTSSERGLRRVATRAQAIPSGIPMSRWAAAVETRVAMAASAAYGSFLSTESLEMDNGAFGISSLEARSMDPQQVFVLQSGYAALVGDRDGALAGRLLRDDLTYSGVGVFVGVEPSGLVVREAASVFSASGGAASITSGRFSYVLGLVGPCYTIDTACSSALAALHVCATALRGGECELSVGFGTKVLSEAANYGTSVAGMTSLWGRCHTFDDRADGYCRGEGCGAFCVRGEDPTKKTRVAVADGRGVAILGSAV